MTPAQEKWLNEHPNFGVIGPPRSVKFEEWGSLHADGIYERLDNAPRKPIQVGTGAIGVAVVEKYPLSVDDSANEAAADKVFGPITDREQSDG